jgi:ABC-type multidrug transport system fused ATPase/permease subunit
MFSENDPSREGAQRHLETVDAVSALYRLDGIAYGTGSQALTQSKRLFQRSLPRASVDNTPECLSRKRGDKEMSEVPLVRFNNVVRRFGDKTVLDGINLKIWVRNRLVILGQSGSGKSTLLRLIPGILQATSGAIFYKNCCIQGLSQNELNLLRARIGMVFQYSALISSMTVRENLALPLEQLGQKSPEEIEAMVKEKLALVGMRDSEDKFRQN